MSTPLDQVLGPVVRLLDPRERDEAAARPILDSVNIPLSELRSRMHELPPRDAELALAHTGEAAQAVFEWLRTHGRHPTLVDDFEFGRTEKGRLWQPNAFLVECACSLTLGRAIDLGCGTGRDAVALAALGWDVVAVDRLPEALERGRDLGCRYLPREARPIEWRVADVEHEPLALGAGYDLVAACFFYHHKLIEQAALLLQPGGSLVLETFTPANRAEKGKPGTDRVADPGELRRLASPLEIRFLEAAWHGSRHTVRLWAAAPSSAT